MARVLGGGSFNDVMLEMSKKFGRGNKVEIGFFEGPTYPDGTSVAFIAAVNEYGNPPRQPPRPFFRNMIADKKHEWSRAMVDLIRENRYDMKIVMEQVGQAIKGQLQQSIRDLTYPPLAPSTIERKGHDKPLEDTLLMLNSVDYKVTTLEDVLGRYD